MAPPPRLRILSVGGNAISAFLSWRLQATASCDVTLVWKQGFEAVSQYGVSFKSKAFGNERFKPRHVVRSPEEASSRENTYDYVILCVKALPEVYDLASVIESVVTPQHTCILVNTTNTLGIETHLEQRYPTNVILSLVSNVEISQTGPSEFEHLSSSEIHVGATNRQSAIPASIQNDMAAALSLTLNTGQVDCKVSPNIRQEQFERMIGPVAFHPASVVFEAPNPTQLLEKIGVRPLVTGIIDELLSLATALGCKFPSDFREKTVEKMSASDSPSTMFQDFQARRPMEVENFLGSPIKLAEDAGVSLPRTEAMYAMLHHANVLNQSKPRHGDSPPASVISQPPPRLSSAPPHRPPMNGAGMRASRTNSSMGVPQARRGPPPGMMRAPPGGPMPPPGARGMPMRDPSLEGGLEEFSHLMIYSDDADGGAPHANGNGVPDGAPHSGPSELALRERELALRQRELQIREQEMGMRRGPGPGPRRGPPPRGPASVFDEEDEDYFDPMDHIQVPHIDPDSVDMMSLTSRRARKAPSHSQMQFRKNPELAAGGPPGPQSRPSSSAFGRYFGRKRASDRVMQEIPGLHDSLMEHPMMSYSSNRYGAVDRNQLHVDSRANSLTASHMGDFPPRPYPQSRRNSQSPAAPFPGGPPGPPGPGPRMGRPMTAHDPSLGPPSGPPHNGHPSPPGNMRTPVPRNPSGQGPMGPHQIEQHYGVSNLYPAKGPPKNKSLTGSASASAESGDSGASANLDSEASAHSSQVSLGDTQPQHHSVAATAPPVR